VTAALLIDLDGALGDTRPLWNDWLEGSSTVLGIDPRDLPHDRGAAAAALDASGAGNWRTLLERFAEDRAPVYLRPSAEASAALRRLTASDHRLGVFTDAPAELARVALAQLGATRRLEATEAGIGALGRLRDRLGDDATVVSTRDELVAAAG
jgi:phosphoglycolate phosphatase-like HAD superfamily hydrolase